MLKPANIIRPLTLLATLMVSTQGLASMSLDRVIVYFKPDQLPRQDVVASNPDSENLYLQTEVYKVLNPGTEQEERIRVSDPSQVKLLATPGKAIIPPNGRKSVVWSAWKRHRIRSWSTGSPSAR